MNARTTRIGEVISTELELATSDNEICGLSTLLNGAEALVVLFVPFCFGPINDGTMENLVIEVNERLDDFSEHDLRVICITKEPPSTVCYWIEERRLKIECYSDGTLDVSNALVGSFDLGLFLQGTKSINLGSYFVPLPSVVIIGGDGKVISKYTAPSPGRYSKYEWTSCIIYD